MPASPSISTRTNGQTIDQTWFNILKTVLDNLWDSFTLLHNEAQYFYFETVTLMDHLTLPATAVFTVPITDDITLLDCEIVVNAAGSAGTVEAGFEYQAPGGSTWVSVLTARPTRVYSAGAGTSSNGVVDPLNDQLDAGGLLRLNIQQLQTDIRDWAVKLSFMRR